MVSPRVSVTPFKRFPKSACFPNEIETHVVSMHIDNKRLTVRTIVILNA